VVSADYVSPHGTNPSNQPQDGGATEHGKGVDLLPALNIEQQVDPNSANVAIHYILNCAVGIAVRFDSQGCFPPLRLVPAVARIRQF
jgi:hypothetical protein